MKNTSLIDPSRCGIVKNNQGAYVSKNEAYALAQTVKDMFVENGIEYEVQQAVCKERSPEASVKVGPTGIKFKLGSLVISSERYSVGSEDGKSISFQKEEGAFVGLDVTIKFKYVIVVIICAVAIMGGTSYYSSVYPEQKVTDVQDTVTQNEMQSPVDDEGVVFAKSSSEMLSEEMVLALSDDRTVGFQRLLRMSINEIYARHGQLFNDGEVNDIHYQKYNWYRETNKHVVEWDEFNDIEKANLRFLISIEEEYGYR